MGFEALLENRRLLAKKELISKTERIKIVLQQLLYGFF